MATFMGDEILPGDIMHDVVDGPITVVSVESDHLRCQKGANRNSIRTYGFDGVLTGRRAKRTLYWHDPITMEPRKHETAYLEQVKAVKLMATLLGEVTVAAIKTKAPVDPFEEDKVVGLAEFLANNR